MSAVNRKPARLGVELVVGSLFLAAFVFVTGMLLFYEDPAPPRGAQLVIVCLTLLVLFLLGALFTALGIGKWRRVGFLSEHGIRTSGRVVEIEGTSTRIGHLPVYRLTMEASGPAGSFRTQVSKALHAHEASSAMGRELRLLVNPNDSSDAILDEETQV